MEDLTFLVSSYVPHANHRVAKHLIGYSTLQYMEHGSLEAHYDEEVYQMTGQWFWPAHPGPYISFHRTENCCSWSHRHIAFQGSRFSQWVSEGVWLNRPQRAPEGYDWPKEFDDLRLLAASRSRWNRLRATNVLEGILLVLAEARNAIPEQEPWLNRVLSLLDDPKIPLNEIATLEGMGLSTLRRRFQLATGTPIHQHRVNCRIARARTMLQETDLPLKVIASRLGYQNEYFFNRQFSQYVGLPPSRYRQTR